GAMCLVHFRSSRDARSSLAASASHRHLNPAVSRRHCCHDVQRDCCAQIGGARLLSKLLLDAVDWWARRSIGVRADLATVASRAEAHTTGGNPRGSAEVLGSPWGTFEPIPTARRVSTRSPRF